MKTFFLQTKAQFVSQTKFVLLKPTVRQQKTQPKYVFKKMSRVAKPLPKSSILLK